MHTLKHPFVYLGLLLPCLIWLLVSCQSRERGGMVFSSMRSGNWELYRLDSENQKPINISRYPATERFPDWSPDGLKLVFTSDREGSSNIYQMDREGNHLLVLAQSPFPDTSPRWSPKGQKLIFVSERFERNENLYLLEPSQSDQPPQRLTDDKSPDYDPAWFPNGQSVIFVSQRKGNSELFQVHLKDPKTVLQITQDGREKCSPEVSYDGKTIAYAVRDDSGWAIETLNLESKQTQRLIKAQKWVGHPRWTAKDELLISVYQKGLFQIERLNLNGQRSPVETGQGDARGMTLLKK